MKRNQCDGKCYREQGHGGSHDVFTKKQVEDILRAAKLKRKNPSIGLREFIKEMSKDKKRRLLK
ncbi:MAG: hypothetical protein HY376_03045 [Candidatus Blackburnbacteria bacterium]|nr:hypothetical protein [Candidatus Blackburnbacteria bacterium]